MIMKILLHTGRVRVKGDVGEQVRFVPNTLIHLWGLKVGGTPGKFGYFYSRLSLKTTFLALKLTQNVNNNISFS